MKKWFLLYPFPGWLLLTLFVLVGNTLLYQFEKSRYAPEMLAQKVQKDFNLREKKVNEALSLGISKISNNEENIEAYKDAFSYIIFQGETPLNWNNSEVPEISLLAKELDSLQTGKITRLQSGVYFAQSHLLDTTGKYLVTLIPIAFQYKYPHKYFQSSFVASKNIPAGTAIGEQGYEIKNLDGRPAFHLQFNQDTYRLFRVDGWSGALSFLALLLACLWIHKMCIEIGRRTKPIFGWLILFGLLVFFNFLRVNMGYPLGFENTAFFSPKVLASGSSIRSFPDLCFYVIFDTWLYLYIVKYVPLQNLFPLRNKFLAGLLHLVISAVLIIELFSGQASYMYSLIIDSKLSFVVNNLQNLTIFTFLGIGLMCLITLNFVFIISIIDSFLKEIIPLKWLRYLAFTVICLTTILLLNNNELGAFYLTLLFFSVAGLVLLNKFGLPIANFAHRKELAGTPHAYIWFLILCSWVTLEIFYFNFSKEKELRKVYAGRLEQQDEALLYYSFNTVSEELQQDRLLKTFWDNPSTQAAQSIDKHIIFHYLGGVFQKYQANIYYLNAQRQPVLQQDSSELALLHRADSLSGKKMEEGLINLGNPLGKNMFWGLFPIFDEAGKQKIGYVGIDFSTDNRPRKSPTALLLLPENNPSDEQYFKDYSYAVYRKHKLEAQAGHFSFPYRSYFDTKNKAYTFKDYWRYSDLFYRSAPDELILIRYQRNIGANIISLFSYVLAIWLILSGLFFLINYFVTHPEKGRLWRNRFNLTIRAKVNWTIMITVFLSLIVVGGITVSFLKTRYQETQRQNLRNLMFYFGQSIVHFIENQKAGFALSNNQAPNQYPPLVYLLNTLAGEQGLDINLYNSQGILMATSQSLLLQKGYLSELMNPVALNQLKGGMQPDWQGVEETGQLNYQSLYLPLRNKNDEIIAYLNLPYYGSQSNLKSEISGILTTLINIYMLIFFIAGLLALLISNSIVRSFYLLIEQFRKIRLEHNVLIHWPYRDELGLLATEYNNMIIKVEKMAARLANSEREAAWRELALQIAHEIKNPLTPMKLNIQYLRKSIKDGHQDVSALAERISNSLIEQIENLNVIATEFAHFARMPEANPEIIEVSEQLKSLLNLYQKEEVNIKLWSAPVNARIRMDKSYFIRIFTNLIKNSLQAIPDGREGMIEVSVTNPEAGKIRIAVKDNGSGIPASLQRRIFTPYFTTKSSGTGIGLAMSKNMAEMSGGTIGFETHSGEGTEFFVILPAYSD